MGYYSDMLQNKWKEFVATPTKAGPSAQAIADADLEKSRRKKSIADAYGLASESQKQADSLQGYGAEQLQAFDKGTEAGMVGIRRNAAQALAAGQAQSGGLGGASGYGALLQAGQQAGQDEAQFQGQQGTARADMAMGIQQQQGDARMNALAQMMQADKVAAEVGTETANQEAQWADLEKQVNTIITDNKGYIDDDEATMHAQIMDIANRTGDPVLRQRLVDKANAILSGEQDI